jgi:hypothetical protein
MPIQFFGSLYWTTKLLSGSLHGGGRGYEGGEGYEKRYDKYFSYHPAMGIPALSYPSFNFK